MWAPPMDPSSHSDGALVVQPDTPRFSTKLALSPGFWKREHLPPTSRLLQERRLGMGVTMVDTPQGKILALPLGKTLDGPVLYWMCPCGSRYVEHKEGENE